MTSSGTQPEGPFDVVSTAVTRANASTAAIVMISARRSENGEGPPRRIGKGL